MKSLLLVAVQLLVCFATESYSEHLESKVEDVEATKRSQRRLVSSLREYMGGSLNCSESRQCDSSPIEF